MIKIAFFIVALVAGLIGYGLACLLHAWDDDKCSDCLRKRDQP